MNRTYALATDLSTPRIVAQVHITGQPPAPLLIGGTHRLDRVSRERVPELLRQPRTEMLVVRWHGREAATV
ncbi:hypothetical protein [Micromonospora sp. NPDC005172]|uniref:hypothetical protein n=1 Tax=Micromonospora sp. NPDC005172 TaxID=3156867 RepID=UPI0033A91941